MKALDILFPWVLGAPVLLYAIWVFWPRGRQSEFAPLRRDRKVQIVGASGVSVVNNKVTLENGGRVTVDGTVVHESSQPSSFDLSSWVGGADSVSFDCSSSDSGSCGDGGGSCGGDGGGGGCD